MLGGKDYRLSLATESGVGVHVNKTCPSYSLESCLLITIYFRRCHISLFRQRGHSLP
jgi:hypothetical protein